MEGTMTHVAFGVSPDLWELVSRACNNTLQPGDQERLELLLSADDDGRRFYGYYMLMHGDLLWRFRAGAIGSLEAKGILSASPVSDVPGLFGHFSSAIHGTIGYFSQEIPFSLLIATVVTGFALWIGSLITVSRDVQISQQPPPPVAEPSQFEKIECVGRITGLAGCKWADPRTEAFTGANVLLGRRYALSSGLMEITYNTGAKVVLQGPVTYEVESPSSGFLSIGKLTARVESMKPQAANHKSEIINQKSSLSTIHYPLFTIKTPTATVTDLGTEFGVEVDGNGHTDAQVFRGAVKVEIESSIAGPSNADRAVVLRESEAVRIEKQNNGGNRQVVLLRKSAELGRFMRTLPPDQRSNRVHVLAHFRMGEDDHGAAAGQPVGEETANHLGSRNLEKRGSPTYRADTLAPGSSLAIDLNGGQLCGPYFYVPSDSNFILEAWVRLQKVQNELVLLAYNGQSEANGFGLVAKCGRWGFLVGDVGWGGMTIPCVPQKWTHLALVRVQGRMQLWVDGRPDGIPCKFEPKWAERDFAVGAIPISDVPGFKGQIDEVRLSEFHGQFKPEMLLFPAAVEQSDTPKGTVPFSLTRKSEQSPAENARYVRLSDPNNVAPLASPTASSCAGIESHIGAIQVASAIDTLVHSVASDGGYLLDADGSNFVFGDSDPSPTLDLEWVRPQHLTSLQAYVSAGDTRNGRDRSSPSVTFFVDHGLGTGWELAGTVATPNTDAIGPFALTRLEGDWPQVKRVRYQFAQVAPVAGASARGPRVAEVLAIAKPPAGESNPQPTASKTQDSVSYDQ